jgi:hypothetical protein
MDDSVVSRDVSHQHCKQGSAASEEIDYDVYYGGLRAFVMAYFPPPVPIINMADYQVNSDEEDEEIKDNTGTTVAVIVQSKMRRLSAEKTRAAFTTFPVFDAHEVRDDDVDEYIPILGRKGTITGMGYTLKNEEISTKNDEFVKARYVWRNFMDRVDGDKEYYPILDERGNMMGINSVPKPSTLPAAV